MVLGIERGPEVVSENPQLRLRDPLLAGADRLDVRIFRQVNEEVVEVPFLADERDRVGQLPLSQSVINVGKVEPAKVQ